MKRFLIFHRDTAAAPLQAVGVPEKVSAVARVFARSEDEALSLFRGAVCVTHGTGIWAEEEQEEEVPRIEWL